MHPSLLSLLQLTDPTLPIGGYAHSFGLETYVQENIVTN
jgi:urease accessory protein